MSKLPTYLLNGKLIAKPLEKKEETSQSGDILIPQTANANLTEALVIKVDQQIEKYVKPGDIIVYPTGSGTGQLISGVPHVWLQINEIWGAFEIDKEDA